MKRKTFSPLTIIGLLVFVGYMLYDRFVNAIPDTIGIPLLVIAILLIVVGNILVRVHNNKL